MSIERSIAESIRFLSSSALVALAARYYRHGGWSELRPIFLAEFRRRHARG